jgi:GH18 family chitinase
MHQAGKKATASLGGGGATFTKTMLEGILGNATYRQNLANLSKTLCDQQGFDGVKIDFEWYSVTNPNNGQKNEANMLDLVKKLRTTLGTGKLINMDLIHSNNGIFTAGNAYPQYVDYFSPMIYDFSPLDLAVVKSKMNAWAQVLPKAKLLAGMALGQYSQSVFSSVCDFVNTDGFGGIMIWEAIVLTQPWYDIIKQKFGTVA